MKQNPFSLYDFLGYMVPGAVLLYVMAFFLGFDVLVAFLKLSETGNTSTNQLLSFIPIVISSYLVGHMLAIGSSSVIEAFSNYANGYPSKFLFKADSVSYLSSPNYWGNSGRLVLWLLIFPISFMKLLLKDLLNVRMFDQAKVLPSPLRNAAFMKCKKVLEDDIYVNTSHLKIDNGIDGDYFRLLYHFIYENSERHASKLQNYVALYGLTRNVSFVFVLSFWIAIINASVKGEVDYLVLAFSFAILAYIFYLGFVKFYRRYTLEVLMAASIYQKSNRE